MKKISEKQKNNVMMLYQETNLKNYQIAELCDLSTASISKILKERNARLKRLNGIDNEEIKNALEMYQNGYEVRVILELCEVSQKQLYDEIHRSGIEKRRSAYTRTRRINPKRETIIEEYKKGKSYAKIANELKISHQMVTRYVKEAIANGEIVLSERYSLKEKTYLMDLAEIMVRSDKVLCTREVANAFRVDEKKLAYRVGKARKAVVQEVK